MLEVHSYSYVRENFKKVIDTVCVNHTPIVIHRFNAEDAMIISYADYSALIKLLVTIKK